VARAVWPALRALAAEVEPATLQRVSRLVDNSPALAAGAPEDLLALLSEARAANAP
jgi:hypothetical protein